VDLTPREKQAKELRESEVPPMTWRRVGTEMGITAVGARAAYARGEDKIKAPNQTGAVAHRNVTSPEYQNPGLAAEMIELTSNPLLENLAEACRESGLPEQTTRSLLKRLNTNYLEVKEGVGKVQTGYFVGELQRVSKLALNSIDAESLQGVNAYQRMLIGAIGIDKIELLSGRPTERISHEDRRTLSTLVPLLLKEAERRGYEVVINPDTGTQHLDAREDAPYQVLSGHEKMLPRGEEPG